MAGASSPRPRPEEPAKRASRRPFGDAQRPLERPSRRAACGGARQDDGGVRALMWRALPALLALLTLLLVLAAPARAANSDKGVIANLISRALSSPSMSVSVGAVEGVLSSGFHDQRHRDQRPRRAVAEGRQGAADLEPARAHQPAARGRSADDRAYAGAAPPAALRRAPARRRHASARSCRSCRSRWSSRTSRSRICRSASLWPAWRRASTWPAGRRWARRPRGSISA